MVLFEILDIIMSHTDPVTSIVTALLLVQMGYTSFQSVKFLIISMKNSSALLNMIVYTIPSVFALTYCIVMPLMLGSFIGGGTDERWVINILHLTASRAFLRELFIVGLCYIVITITYRRVYQHSWMQWLANFGIEFLFLLILFVIYGGLLLDDAPFSIVALASLDMVFVTYAVFMYVELLYKLALTAISFALGMLFWDRRKPIYIEKSQIDILEEYKKAVEKFIGYQGKKIGIAIFMLFTLLFALLCFLLLNDTGDEFTMSNMVAAVSEVGFLIPLAAVAYLISTVHLIFGFFPCTTPAYRILARKSKDEDLFQLFYQEVVVPHQQIAEQETITTEHFIVTKAMSMMQITVR